MIISFSHTGCIHFEWIHFCFDLTPELCVPVHFSIKLGVLWCLWASRKHFSQILLSPEGILPRCWTTNLFSCAPSSSSMMCSFLSFRRGFISLHPPRHLVCDQKTMSFCDSSQTYSLQCVFNLLFDTYNYIILCTRSQASVYVLHRLVCLCVDVRVAYSQIFVRPGRLCQHSRTLKHKALYWHNRTSLWA